MKKVTTTLLLFILVSVIVLTGCSKKENNAAPTESKSTSTDNEGNSKAPASMKDIVIEYWSTPTFKDVEGMSNPNFGDWEQAKIAEFVKENPNVKINFQTVPFDAVEQKMTVALSGNNPPDILLDGLDRRLMKYVKFGKNEPLNDFIEQDREDYNADVLQTFTRDGQLYGIPIYIGPEFMFLNKKIFEDKGLGHLIPADRQWTFEQWRDAMKQVSGDGIYGSAVYAGNEQADEMNLMYFFGAGVDQWNEDSTEVVMGKNPEAANVLQMLIDMVKEGSLAPGPATLKPLDVYEMFRQGKIAMIPWVPDIYNDIENGQKDGSASPNIEIYGINIVHKAGVTPKAPAAFSGYTVFKQSDPDKREMIKKFLNFMLTSDNVKLLAKSVNSLPARASSTYEYGYKDLSEVMEIIKTLPPANLGKSSPAYGEVRQQWYPALQAAFLGTLTPEQAIEEYTKKANEILANQK